MPQQPLRLLLTTPNLDTAGSKYILADLIRCLDRSAIRPSLCVHRRTYTALEREMAGIVDELLELPLRLPARPVFALWQRAGEIAHELRGRFDIIQSFDYASDWQEGLVARRSGIPWIVVKTNLSWNRRWWLKSLLAQRIVTYSQQQYDLLYKGTVFAQKTSIIHVGIDLTLFEQKQQADKLLIRAELGLPQNAMVLGCVAHLVPVKGHVELIKAFGQVVERDPDTDIYLVLAGGGEPAYETELRNLAAGLGVAERVLFLGLRTDVARLLSGFDGLILATRNWGRKEAFGVVLIEAMASGLPVIATRSGGPEDIVLPGETGWLVEAEGEVPLANAISEFLRDPVRGQRFGAAGRQRARELFSRELMVEKYQQLYQEWM